jgi:hypothetical protein
VCKNLKCSDREEGWESLTLVRTLRYIFGQFLEFYVKNFLDTIFVCIRGRKVRF